MSFQEALAKTSPLSTQWIELKNQSNAKISSLLRKEEIKWYQRSKRKFIIEGDSNTRYFHSVANGTHRNKSIHTLFQDECTIRELDNLKYYITNYYKNLFGSPEEGNFYMDETHTDDIPQVSIEENNLFTAEYSEEEVSKAIFQMEQ
jgi:mannosylglycoprotein endo-beta-mannosidase